MTARAWATVRWMEDTGCARNVSKILRMSLAGKKWRKMKAYKVKITKKIVDVVILVMFAVIWIARCLI